MRWRVLEVGTFVVTLAVAVVVDLLTTPEDFEIWTMGTLGSQAFAAVVVTIAALFGPGRDAAAGRDPDPGWRVPWLVATLPVAVTVVLLPTILTGGLDSETTGVGMALLFVLLGVVALLLGGLTAVLLLLPLALLLRTVVRAIGGRASLPQLPLLLLMPAAIGMAVGGALGLDLPVSGRRAVLPMLLGLLGVAEFGTSSPGWLWFGRVCLLALVLCCASFVPWRRLLGIRARRATRQPGET